MWPRWSRLADRWSLQRRLSAGLFAILGILAAIIYLIHADYAERAADRAFDRLLLASALAMADGIQVQDGRVTIDLPYAALAILGTGRRDRVFYRVAAPDGTFVTGYQELAQNLPLARTTEPRFADIHYGGAELRVVLLGRFVAGTGGTGWTTIIVGHTRDERSLLANEILANAAAPLVVIVAAAVVLIWFGVRRALAPLALLERLIRLRDPNDFSPIAAPVPQEVSQLLGALNSFMQRLQASLRLMQTFLADAAHQIRTPLASLRAQADLAIEEEDPADLRRQVERIHRNAAHASQLTNQLLSHAMITHRRELRVRQKVDLDSLAEQVVQRASALVEEGEVRIDRADLRAPAQVWGDPVALREALTNLVDNALKYAGRHGPVELRLVCSPGSSNVRIEVTDRGAGIPDAEKAPVLERFSRGTTAGPVVGSGLGLAIVKEAAAMHDGTLTLLDRPGGGLLARLDLPVMDGAAGVGRPARLAASFLLGAALV